MGSPLLESIGLGGIDIAYFIIALFSIEIVDVAIMVNKTFTEY